MHFNLREPMAIHPDWSEEIVNLASGKSQSDTVDCRTPYIIPYVGAEFDLSALEARETDSDTPGGLVAVVPIYGVLSPGGYGGTSLDRLPGLLRSLDRNTRVSDIILDVRSPGGTVMGTPEAAAAVRGIRDSGKTRVVSVANGMMASGATWIGTAAKEVYVTPSGSIGSIGVIWMYGDSSAAWEKFGVKLDILRTPAKKARFSGVEPLSDDMREHMQTAIGKSYEQFRAAMAANRGVNTDDVESKFGGGEMLKSDEALSAKLVDGIATLDEVITRTIHTRSLERKNRTDGLIRSIDLDSVKPETSEKTIDTSVHHCTN